MSLSVYMKGVYEEFHALKAAKNKAKQSQTPAFGRKLEALNPKQDEWVSNDKARRHV